ncbi:MAG: alcohol dehydrogenase [Deltaproteobacteria bacterium]|nr:MAG: alcohol dehydrogenase [Deltaproteobacteria bacterium]
MQNEQMFQTTPRIIMGAGTISKIVTEINQLRCKKAMIVTDPGLVKAGIMKKLEDILTDGNIAFTTFDQVEPDPRLEIAISASVLVQESGTDIIIGLGGGSSIDIAKIASILATNKGDLSSYLGVDLIPEPGLKTIIVPTTAGTGSEVTPIVILSDVDEKLKKGAVSPFLFPDVAILDPALTVGLPPQVTAATGMDALIHAVEAFTSINATSITDMLAEQAIKLISQNLRTAYSNGNDLEVRYKMLEGSMLAGMAFANAGVTAVHAFAYPIGAEFHIPHGIANSIMLIPVMKFNMMGNLNKFSRMATFFQVNTAGLNQREAAMLTIKAMQELSDDLQLPKNLSDYGVKEADIPLLAEGVMKVTRLLANNPRILTQKDAEAIYRQVL